MSTHSEDGGDEQRSAGDAWLWHALRSQYGDESQAEEGFYAGWIARDALAPAAVAVVLPTVDQAMKVVMRYQWEDKANVTGTTNWAANLGMAVVNEVARLNRRAIPVGLLERIVNQDHLHTTEWWRDVGELRALLKKQ